MRIYPAYLVAALATVVLTYVCDPENWNAIISAVPGVLTFTREEHFIGIAFLVLWTLQIEMAFYLILPWAMLLLGPARGLLTASVAMAGLSIMFLFGMPSVSPVQIYAGDLAFGSLVAMAWKGGLLDRLKLPPWIWVGIGLTGIALLLFQPGYSGLLFTGQIMAASLCGCALIVAFVKGCTPACNSGNTLDRAHLLFVYLLHAIILQFRFVPNLIFDPIYWLFHHNQVSTRTATFLVTVTLVAAISDYAIEKPGDKGRQALDRH